MVGFPNEIANIYIGNGRKSYLVLLSAFRGWGILNIKQPHLFPCWGLTLKTHQISSVIFGMYKNYFQYITILGMGYKLTKLRKTLLILRLGYSHRILLVADWGVQISYLSKQLVCLKSRSLNLLKNLAYKFRKNKKLSAYKKKGLCFKGELLSLKESSKKALV